MAENDEGRRPFAVTHRTVFAIAVPMTLAYITTPLVGIVNLGAVGQLGDAAVVGGVSIGALVFDIVFVTFNFLRMATTGLAAQAYGAGDRRAMNAALWRGVFLAALIGIVVVVFHGAILAASLSFIGGSNEVQAATTTYFQTRVLASPFTLANFVILGWLIGINRAGQGLALQIVLNGINIVLSITFVTVLGWGVAGVGWASVIAEVIAAAAGFAIVLRVLGRDARTTWREIVDPAELKRLAVLNRDIMIRSFALLFAFAFFTARSAAGGDVQLAANEILLNLVIFAAFFLDGLAAAAEQLAGRAIGARWRPAFDRAVKLTVVWGFVVALGVAAVMLVAGTTVIGLMTTNADVRAAAHAYLIFAVLVPITGTLAYQMDGVFIGATWSVEMRNMMLASLALYLVAWYFLEAWLGIAGLWIALLIFLSARGLSLSWRLRVLVGPAFA